MRVMGAASCIMAVMLGTVAVAQPLKAPAYVTKFVIYRHSEISSRSTMFVGGGEVTQLAR